MSHGTNKERNVLMLKSVLKWAIGGGGGEKNYRGSN